MLYTKRPVNLPGLKRPVQAHIPCGVPDEWRLVHDCCLQALRDPVNYAVAEGRAPGSNRVTAALIEELLVWCPLEGGAGTPPQKNRVPPPPPPRAL